MIIIFVHVCFHWNFLSSQCQSSPLSFFCFVCVRKRQEFLIWSRHFWRSNFLVEWMIFHTVVFRFTILCFASQLWNSGFQIFVGFITVSEAYIPFIQTKISTLPLANHYINIWYVNPVCFVLKRYHTEILFILMIYSNEKSLSVKNSLRVEFVKVL